MPYLFHTARKPLKFVCHLQKESSEVFFAVTKLFQNADLHLRRMVYLCLKDICPDAEEVMIVTNSLMKDMNCLLYTSPSPRD